MAAIDFGKVKQGSQPTLTFVWPLPSDPAHTPDDLDGFTITGVMQNIDTGDVTAISSGAVTVITGATRTCAWAMGSTDTGTAGSFLVVLTATDGSTPIKTLNGSIYIESDPSVTAIAGESLEGVPTSDAAWLSTSAAGGALGTAAYENTDAFDAAGSAAAETAVAAHLSAIDHDNIPTVAQAAALAAYQTALTAGNEGEALLKTAEGVEFGAVAGGISLSDYSNVIVVDAAGNGDFTTLQSALNSLSGLNVARTILVWSDSADNGELIASNLPGDIHVVIIGELQISRFRFSGVNLTISGRIHFTQYSIASVIELYSNVMFKRANVGRIVTSHSITLQDATLSSDNSLLPTLTISSEEDVSYLHISHSKTGSINFLTSSGELEGTDSVVGFVTTNSFSPVISLTRCTVAGLTSNTTIEPLLTHCSFGSIGSNIVVTPGNYSNTVAGATWPVIP